MISSDKLKISSTSKTLDTSGILKMVLKQAWRLSTRKGFRDQNQKVPALSENQEDLKYKFGS
jgi:hypothetical protein